MLSNTARSYILVGAVACLISQAALCQETKDADAARLAQEGLSHFETGDIQTAIASYTKALELEPDNAGALYERAMAYQAAREYSRCLADAESGIALKSPLEPRFYAIGGSCLSADGKAKKALRLFRKGLKSHPDDASLNLNTAVTLANTGEDEEARSHLKSVLRREPNHPSANLYLASLFQRGGYRVPAVYQHLRFLAVEPASDRSASAAVSLLQVLNLGLEQTGEKSFNLTLFTGQPTDEGDFGPLNTGLTILAAAATTEKYRALGEAERLSRIIDSLVGLAQERKETEMKTTFVWQHAIGYLISMREASVLEPFSYVAFSRLKLNGSQEWLQSHQQDLADLEEWMKER